MMKRFLKRLGLTTLAVMVLLAIIAWVTLTWVLTRPTSYNPSVDVGPITLLSWPEHDAKYRETTFPYILSAKSKQGALEYVGALHTSDAAEPQLKIIEQRWEEFKPTVAFCEGRARMFRFAGRTTTGQLSESELTRILANQNRIPLYTLEPTYEAEVAGLLKQFEPKLVATYMTLRVYSAESDPNIKNQDGLALALMRKRTNVQGLKNTFSKLSELDRYWQETFPQETDWRAIQNIDRIPLLVTVGNVARQIRGENMIRSLVELANRGERVFAVVGASHVIRQEPVLRRLLDDVQVTDSSDR